MTNTTTINGVSAKARTEFTRLKASLEAQGRTVRSSVNIFESKTKVIIEKVDAPARVGKARCHPDDTFDVNIGLVIAMYRALGWEVPSCYIPPTGPRTSTNAVQAQETMVNTDAKAQAKNLVCNVFGVAPKDAPAPVASTSPVTVGTPTATPNRLHMPSDFVVTATDIVAIKAEFKGDVNSLAYALAAARKCIAAYQGI